ncbi:unnamed protein product, partial [Dibothriocephalus latus]
PPVPNNPPLGQRRKLPPRTRPPPPLVDEFIDLVECCDEDDAPGNQSERQMTPLVTVARPDSTPPPDLDQMEEGGGGGRSPTVDDHLSEVAQLSYPACLSTPNIHSTTHHNILYAVSFLNKVSPHTLDLQFPHIAVLFIHYKSTGRNGFAVTRGEEVIISTSHMPGPQMASVRG